MSRVAVEAAVRQRAAERGFPDPDLLVATVWQESNFDPGAVGDQGHSIGPFQENDRGRGAGLSAAQRSDVVAATDRAIDEFSRYYKAGLDPGTIAAQAQRPADPQGYAAAVNQKYQQLKGSVGTSIQGPPAGGSGANAPGWLQLAGAQVGKPYIWGSKGGRSDFSDAAEGFDCSGFVSYIYKKGLGVDLPAFTGSAYPATQGIKREEAKAGDLVFYNMNQGNPRLQHVAIYLGNGKIIQSGGQGDGVNVAPVDQMANPEFRRAPAAAPKLGVSDASSYFDEAGKPTEKGTVWLQGGTYTAKNPGKPVNVSAEIEALTSAGTSMDDLLAGLERLSSQPGSTFDLDAASNALLRQLGVSGQPVALVQLGQRGTSRPGTIAQKGTQGAMSQTAGRQPAGTPADVLQAYFNAVLLMTQQANANVEKTGYAPRMMWDPDAYNGVGGFVPTGDAVETMALVMNRFSTNRSQISALATIAASTGMVPQVQIDDNGYLFQAYDPMTGRPLYNETTASRTQRQSAGEATGFVQNDLLRQPQQVTGMKVQAAPGENMMRDQAPIGLSQQQPPAPAPAQDTGFTPNPTPGQEGSLVNPARALGQPVYSDPQAGMQYPSGEGQGSAYGLNPPDMGTPENQAWLAQAGQATLASTARTPVEGREAVDLGNGRARTYYQDGSFEDWDITPAQPLKVEGVNA